jgi:hypothetical protein
MPIDPGTLCIDLSRLAKITPDLDQAVVTLLDASVYFGQALSFHERSLRKAEIVRVENAYQDARELVMKRIEDLLADK